MLGAPGEKTEHYMDLTIIEKLTLIPVIIMIFWIGLFPGFFLNLAEPAIQDILMLIK
jgi:NADH-quinone oxidoreductase subunit M